MNKSKMKKLFTIILVLFCAVLIGSTLRRSSCDYTYCAPNYDVIAITKRPDRFYTQGMFFDDEGKTLYHSGGLYEKSTIGKCEMPCSQNKTVKRLASNLFAEGIAKCGDFVYQLTWRENKIIKYAYPSLEYVEDLTLPDGTLKEGWGLSSFENKNEVIATDGSSTIYVFDCSSGRLEPVRKFHVMNEGTPLDRLNDLTYAKGHVYANRYFDSNIYKIDSSSGQVVDKYDLNYAVNYELNKRTLTTYGLQGGNVLNGIAYNAKKDTFLITGKTWGNYYEVKFK